jgi:hypothetical protein
MEASGLFCLSPSGEIRRFSDDDSLTGNSILSLHVERSEQIWVGMRFDSLPKGRSIIAPEANQNDKFSVRRFTNENGSPSTWVNGSLSSVRRQNMGGGDRRIVSLAGRQGAVGLSLLLEKNNLCGRRRANAR